MARSYEHAAKTQFGMLMEDGTLRPMVSSDFGPNAELVQAAAPPPSLRRPPPTLLIRVPAERLKAEAVLKQAADDRKDLSWRLLQSLDRSKARIAAMAIAADTWTRNKSVVAYRTLRYVALVSWRATRPARRRAMERLRDGFSIARLELTNQWKGLLEKRRRPRSPRPTLLLKTVAIPSVSERPPRREPSFRDRGR